MDASLAHEVMNALVAGSVIGAGDVVKDQARRLMDLVRGKFHGDPKAEGVLERYSDAPELIGPLLEPYLDEYEIASDPEVCQLAREIVHSQSVTAHGDAAMAIGTLHQHVAGNASVSVGGIHSHTTSAPAPQPCWAVRHARSALYTLANESDAIAYDVTIAVPGAARFDPPENPDPTWTEHESRTFCANTLQQHADQIIVTYRLTPNGEVKTWRRALPHALTDEHRRAKAYPWPVGSLAGCRMAGRRNRVVCFVSGLVALPLGVVGWGYGCQW